MTDKASQNARLVNTCELDDFDKLIVIKGWFHHFTPGQQENLIRILNEEMTKEKEGSSV